MLITWKRRKKQDLMLSRSRISFSVCLVEEEAVQEVRVIILELFLMNRLPITVEVKKSSKTKINTMLKISMPLRRKEKRRIKRRRRKRRGKSQ